MTPDDFCPSSRPIGERHGVFTVSTAKHWLYYGPAWRRRRELAQALLDEMDREATPDRPPYLLFLNQLFADLGAERIEAMKINGLRFEIRRRWPDQFGPPSENLIGPMATILRSLEAKRGGAKRQLH
jgi:hypothetical protein